MWRKKKKRVNMKTFGWIQSTAQDNITAEKKDNISFSNLIFKYTWEQQVVLQYGFFLHIQIYRPTVQLVRNSLYANIRP